MCKTIPIVGSSGVRGQGLKLHVLSPRSVWPNGYNYVQNINTVPCINQNYEQSLLTDILPDPKQYAPDLNCGHMKKQTLKMRQKSEILNFITAVYRC